MSNIYKNIYAITFPDRKDKPNIGLCFKERTLTDIKNITKDEALYIIKELKNIVDDEKKRTM